MMMACLPDAQRSVHLSDFLGQARKLAVPALQAAAAAVLASGTAALACAAGGGTVTTQCAAANEKPIPDDISGSAPEALAQRLWAFLLRSPGAGLGCQAAQLAAWLPARQLLVPHTSALAVAALAVTALCALAAMRRRRIGGPLARALVLAALCVLGPCAVLAMLAGVLPQRLFASPPGPQSTWQAAYTAPFRQYQSSAFSAGSGASWIKGGFLLAHFLLAVLVVCKCSRRLSPAASLASSAMWAWMVVAVRHIVAACGTEQWQGYPSRSQAAALQACVVRPSHYLLFGRQDAACFAACLMCSAAAHALAHRLLMLQASQPRQPAAAQQRAGKAGEASSLTQLQVAAAQPQAQQHSDAGPRKVVAAAACASGKAAAVPRAVAGCTQPLPSKCPANLRYTSRRRTVFLQFKIVPPPQQQLQGGAADSAGAYNAAALRVRSSAVAALGEVSSQRRLSVVSPSLVTFPGCVHLALSAQLAGEPGQPPHDTAELEQQLLASIERHLPPGFIIQHCSAATAAADAAAALPYPQPVALPAAAAIDGSHRIELMLPAGLAAKLCGNSDSCSGSSAHSLRVVVAANTHSQEGGVLLLDSCSSAADLVGGPSAPRLPLHIPAANLPGGVQLLLVHVLLVHVLLCCQDPRGQQQQEEVLLAQLPLLVLPAAACEELTALFEAMTAACSGDAAAAFHGTFAPLAGDLAVVLQPPGADHTSGGTQEQCAALAEDLLLYLSMQERSMPTCMQLAQTAAAAAAWTNAQCESGSCSSSGQGASGSQAARLPAWQQQQQQQQQQPPLLTAAALVWGFPPAAEAGYQLFKAQRLASWDLVSAIVRLLCHTAPMIKVEAVARGMTGVTLAMWVLRGSCLAAIVPPLVCLLARRLYLRHRDAWELGGKVGSCLVFAPALLPGMPPITYMQLAGIVEQTVERIDVLIVWDYFMWPVLQRLTLPLHFAGCAVLFMRDTLIRRKRLESGMRGISAMSPATTTLWLLCCFLLSLMLVAVMELRMRWQFVHAVAAAERSGAGSGEHRGGHADIARISSGSKQKDA